eukprot:scaffold96_cov167-Ochromonas_danica.AAC.5
MALYGFDIFLLAMCVSAVAFLVLTCSLSEIVSIVPFSGGCYGYVRCTLGSTIGYITGVMEASKFIMYTAALSDLITQVFVDCFDFDQDTWLPVIWLGLYILCIVVPMMGTKVIWWCWGVVAIATLIVQLIFIFGAIQYGKIRNLGPRFNHFDNSLEHFLHILPYSAFLFIGIDDVRTCASDHSNKVVPWAMLLVMCSSGVIAISTIICARMYEVNYLKFMLYAFPYSLGVETTLGDGVDQRYLSLFSLPPLLGGLLAMTFAGGRQICSMACSGLLPNFLAIVQTKDDALPLPEQNGDVVNASQKEPVVQETKPILAIMTTCLFSYVILLGSYYSRVAYFLPILSVAGLHASVVLAFAMGAYLVFATRFSGMERGFVSPFGMVGAAVLMVFSATICINIYYFSEPENRRGIGMGQGVFFGICMIYYVLVASKTQFFSKEEQDKFMKAYIVNANKKRRDATTNKSKKSDMSSAILSTIMKYVFNKTVTISAPVSNSVDPAVAANIMAGNGVGMKGNKVSPSAPLGTTISVVP